MKTAYMNSSDFNRIMAAVKGFERRGINDIGGHSILEYICLEFDSKAQQVTAVACDGYRLSAEHAVANCEESLICHIKHNVRFPNDRKIYIAMRESLDRVTLECDHVSVSYVQPCGEYFNWRPRIPATPPNYSIAFNGNLLLDALKAAKISCGRSFKGPLVIEFRDSNDPIVIRTNEDDIKLVLPLRMQKREGEK